MIVLYETIRPVWARTQAQQKGKIIWYLPLIKFTWKTVSVLSEPSSRGIIVLNHLSQKKFSVHMRAQVRSRRSSLPPSHSIRVRFRSYSNFTQLGSMLALGWVPEWNTGWQWCSWLPDYWNPILKAHLWRMLVLESWHWWKSRMRRQMVVAAAYVEGISSLDFIRFIRSMSNLELNISWL